LAVHGSPGSHNDFRELIPKLAAKNFRILAPNFPGHSDWTPIDPYHGKFRHSSAERAEFLFDFIQKLNLPKVDLFIGHSAGCYPLIKYFAQYRPDSALMLINPGGATPHRLVRPYWLTSLLGRLYQTWLGRWLLRPLFYLIMRITMGKIRNVDYSAVGLAVGNGINFDELPNWIRTVRENLKRPLVLLYSMNDPFVEFEKCVEFGEKFGIFSENSIKFDENEKIFKNVENLIENGGKVAVVFESDGHFVQKKRSDFIVKLIEFLFRS